VLLPEFLLELTQLTVQIVVGVLSLCCCWWSCPLWCRFGVDDVSGAGGVGVLVMLVVLVGLVVLVLLVPLLFDLVVLGPHMHIVSQMPDVISNQR